MELKIYRATLLTIFVLVMLLSHVEITNTAILSIILILLVIATLLFAVLHICLSTGQSLRGCYYRLLYYINKFLQP